MGKAKGQNPFVAFVQRYQDDPVGFVRNVLGVEPDEWQAQLLTWVSQNERRISVASGHGVGKAGRLTDRVETPLGERAWGDLQPGDEVFGADGSPTRIVARTDYEQIPFYRVRFDDRSYVDVSSGHLWRVRGRQERRKALDTWRTMETVEILEAGVKRPNGKAEARQWEIPIQGAVQYPEQPVPVDPYFMGVWLGDGTKAKAQYLKPYREVADRLRDRGVDVRATEAVPDRYLLKEGQEGFLALDVSGCGSHERYVPDVYKRNTVEVRRAVFEGLCDTDGEVHHSGSIGFSSSSKQLAEDFIWLARSLGCKAMLQPTVKKPTYETWLWEYPECRDSYRVTVNAPFNPFTVEHKRARFKPSEPRYLKRWIDSIEYIGQDDGMCITVEAPDGLYQARNFTVTHNSTTAAWAMLWFVVTRYPVKVVVTAPTSAQLFDAMFAELKRWIQELPEALQELWEVKADRVMLKASPTEAFISARTSRAEQPEALQGIHSDHVMLIADEASGVPEAVFEAAAGSMSGESATTLLLGNPTRGSGFFYDTHHRLRGQWKTLRVSCEDSKRVSQAYVDEMKARYGEESNAYRVRVLGLFPVADDDTVIPLDLVVSATNRDVEASPTAPVVWGVDVARFGDDRSALAKRQANVLLEPIRTWKGLDTMQLTGAVKAEWDALEVKDRPVEILVDSIGLGAGVVDRLVELGLPARGINVSESASMSEMYHNLRSELWHKARAWLASRDCRLPEDADLEAELVAPRYSFTSTGKIQLEGKDQMKRRGLPSPDRADAFVMTFASDATVAMHGGRARSWSQPLRRRIPGIV